MSRSALETLFRPESVAVIGAARGPGSIGAVVLQNLLQGQFGGPVMPVASDARALAGVLAYRDVDALPLTPDLALLCDEDDALNASLIEQLARRGTAVAVVMGAVSDRAMLRSVAEVQGLRLLGARSLGVIVPSARLNASAAHVAAHAGGIAFVSQSDAMCSTILDWARPRGIGFSHFVSLGEGTDIDFGDVLDQLANEDEAKAILLYIERIDERRGFVPAARAAARNKPLLLLKAGRSNPDQPIGAFLSESLATPDEVFDALARRTGALRVDHIDELFAAAETLSRTRRVRGERLAVLCNGADAGLMATDELALSGAVPPAQLPAAVFERLGSIAAPNPVPGNPVDLGTAAGPSQYAGALEALVEEADPDVVLAMHAPTVRADGVAIARAIAHAHERLGGNLLTCWLGGETAQAARRVLSEAGLPTYDTLGHAVRGFRHMVNYHRNQTMLLETPPSGLTELRQARERSRPAIERALQRPGGFLTDPEVRDTLAAYGIAAMQSVLAPDPARAAYAAVRLGFPVALTYASQDVPRKWDVGGVALNLESAEAVEVAAEAMLRRVALTAPQARFDGFAIQKMALRPHARQLMIGLACDRLFGPVVVFGEGGRAVEVVRDHALAMPPLNRPLARHLISLTRVARRLDAQGVRPAANLDAIADALVAVSVMLADHPELLACDINPLFADEQGVLVVDARIRVAPIEHDDRRRVSIRSYPSELEEAVALSDGECVVLRPVRPEDEASLAELVARMDEQDLRSRFMGRAQRFDHPRLARLTQIDYEREMAFVAIRETADGRCAVLGEVRTVLGPNEPFAELAIMVRSDWKGRGLGSVLMRKMLAYHGSPRSNGILAQVMAANSAMLALARKFGFEPTRGEDPDIIECRLEPDQAGTTR
ncbi:MAG: bifunctional acetate--CoA ligase family protein/GNAT family N-acetyltransferase [Burkholderiaceae bacterium]|nr:bifunctional acetate--CoA ligase family protein/GNAT family N-acetyltransferase [Burkholderiaceae bacterium]